MDGSKKKVETETAAKIVQMAPTMERIMQVATGFWPSKTLLSAVQLGVFSELASGPQNLETIRERLGLHERSAKDFLDSLVALGFLYREDGQYRNTEETGMFLDPRKPSYIGGAVEMLNKRLYGFWGNLTEALQTGQQQNEAKEKGADSLFATLYANPTRLKQFLAAMSGLSRGANCAIAEKVAWGNYRTYADVGAAQGDLAVQIALKNSHLKGIGYDLAVVRPVFEEYVHENGLAERLCFEAGDFFKDAMPSVDVITMGHILHDWNLEQKKDLIAKAYAALKPGGLLVVYDAIIDDDRSKNAFGLMMSLNMLIETPGGFDYTGAECTAWMQEAGFREVRVEHLVGPDSMVVGQKA